MTISTTIRKISYASILGAPNAQALIDEYDAECSIPMIGKISPKAATYSALEQAGMLHCFGAYAGDGTLVGFASLLITELPHYSRRVATVESLFVTPGSRPDGAGKRLMRAIEEHAHMFGCEHILYSAPVESSLAMMLLASKPYKCTNVVFCRSLA
jgi:GNAT superfamily N-acetyltransferase